jgi:methylated-DNA-[protein]-cysteine S-methyltransferase
MRASRSIKAKSSVRLQAATGPNGAVEIAIFETPLGWIAVAGQGNVVRQVVFACPTRQAALQAIDKDLARGARTRNWCPALARKLEDYAEGIVTDFREVEIDLASMTPLQRRIIKHCREIPYGQTRTYGQLASAAGAPGAARAVGTTMSLVRFPLIVPCQRVVRAGKMGGSLPRGERVRVRLRTLEQRSLATQS